MAPARGGSAGGEASELRDAPGLARLLFGIRQVSSPPARQQLPDQPSRLGPQPLGLWSGSRCSWELATGGLRLEWVGLAWLLAGVVLARWPGLLLALGRGL